MNNEKEETAAEISANSKYRREFDAMLLQHLSEGLSFEAFAGVVKVNRDTLYQWIKRYSSFKEAKEEGTSQSLLYWEGMGISGTVGKIPGFNTAMWIFNMKNRFRWRDRQEVKNLGPEEQFTDVVTHDKIMAYIEGKKF